MTTTTPRVERKIKGHPGGSPAGRRSRRTTRDFGAKPWDFPPAGRRSRRTAPDFGAKPWDFPPPGEAAGATRDFRANPLDFPTPGGGAAGTAPLLQKINKFSILIKVCIDFTDVFTVIFKQCVP